MAGDFMTVHEGEVNVYLICTRMVMTRPNGVSYDTDFKNETSLIAIRNKQPSSINNKAAIAMETEIQSLYHSIRQLNLSHVVTAMVFVKQYCNLSRNKGRGSRYKEVPLEDHGAQQLGLGDQRRF
eukprot:gene9757-20292_t